VAHSIYGVASTINSANYVLFLALEKVQQLGHPDATKVYTEQLLELHRGQGMEIYWRDNFQCPEESDYKLMTIRKTGGLFMLAIRLMLLFSDNGKDFTKLTALLGKRPSSMMSKMNHPLVLVQVYISKYVMIIAI
jgi:geranylgeranyl diphosphate synthase type 3